MIGDCQKRKKERHTKATGKDDGFAADSGRKDSCNWHCCDRACSKTKEQNSQGSISNVEPALGERDQRSPTGHPEAGCDKTEPGG
jgi:hypothetical protein